MGSHTTIDGGSPVTVVTDKTSKMCFEQTEAEGAWNHNDMVVLVSLVLSPQPGEGHEGGLKYRG